MLKNKIHPKPLNDNPKRNTASFQKIERKKEDYKARTKEKKN